MQIREEEAKQYLDELSGNIYKIGDLGTTSEKCKFMFNLYKSFKQNGPYDVVHCNMDLLNGINLTVARLVGIKKRICHSHTTASQYEEKTNRHFLVASYRAIMKFLIKSSATKMLGCSNMALEYMYGKECVNSKNCILTYNGIDFLKFNKEIRTENNNIITVGAIESVKNPFFMVEVMNELRKIRSDFKFLWVGDGELRKEVEQKISDYKLNDYIELLGIRNDVDKLLKQCSVFLMPSLFEGLSISLVEAQACDLACVVSNGMTTESDCGKCDFLPLEKGAEYWAMVIDDYLSGRKRKELNEDLINRFDDRKTIAKIEEVYMS